MYILSLALFTLQYFGNSPMLPSVLVVHGFWFQTSIRLYWSATICLSILLLIDTEALFVFGYYDKAAANISIIVFVSMCFSFYLTWWRISWWELLGDKSWPADTSWDLSWYPRRSSDGSHNRPWLASLVLLLPASCPRIGTHDSPELLSVSLWHDLQIRLLLLQL